MALKGTMAVCGLYLTVNWRKQDEKNPTEKRRELWLRNSAIESRGHGRKEEK